MGLVNWLRRRTRGVEDPARDANQHTDPRQFVYYTIENAPFQKWVVFVAAVGFLTDAYDIFALNVITQILPYIYDTEAGVGVLAQKWQAGMLISTLAGTMIGQIAFGILGDLYGRRKMYGLELIVLIVGSIGTAMASEGRGSMSVYGWLVVWRLIMGVGIGADYPLSAVIASEFAPRRHRARMLGFVFWMQPIGQVIVLSIGLVAVQVCQPWLSTCSKDTPADCASQLDSIWRWVVGLGAVPAALAISFRMTIPQSPRFLMDNKKEIDTAVLKATAYYGTPEVPFSVQMAQVTPLRTEENGHTEMGKFEVLELPPAASNSSRPSLSIADRQSGRLSRASSFSAVSDASTPHMVEELSHPTIEEEPSWLNGFKEYFFKQGNWRLLAGTAGTWFLLDIPFYGLGLSSAAVVNTVWHNAGAVDSTPQTMYDILFETLWHSLVIVSLGGLIGGAIFLKLVKYASPKTIQFWGFLVLTVLLVVTGSAFPFIASPGSSGPIILYALIQLFFNLGPNTTSYLIPAELFPTRYRCTAHGLSAAAGRFGGICAQLFVTFARFPDHTLADALKPPIQGDSGDLASNGARTLGIILAVFSVFTALGAGVTWFLTPDTRDKAGNPRSLETLAKGYAYLKELKGETAPEDRIRDPETS